MSCKCGHNKDRCTCGDTGCHGNGSLCDSFDGGFSGVNGCDVFYSGCDIPQIGLRRGCTFDETVHILTTEMFRRDCEYRKLLKSYEDMTDDYEQLLKKFEEVLATVNQEEET